MAKRVALLALVLLLLGQAGLAEAPRGLDRLERAYAYLQERRFVESALEKLCAAKPRQKVRTMDDWVMHADGFAFRVPEGMEMSDRTRGMDILLEDSREGTVPFRTIISVSVSKGEDRGLKDTTEEAIVGRYRSKFSRFQLLDFQRDASLGDDGIRITFLCEDSIQMLVQQHLFNRDGYSYILTLFMENTLAQTHAGFAQYAVLRDSLLFVQP